MKPLENTYKDWFSSLLGSAAMVYAGYGWHVDWITSKEAGIVAFIGFVLLFLRTRLTQVISDGLGRVFDAVMGKIFGKGGPPPTAMLILAILTICYGGAAGQNVINTKEVRFVNKTDSVGIAGVGMQRWDAATGKFRFWNGSSWSSYTIGGITGIGVVDSQTKSANGAVKSGSGLYLQTADATYPGLVSTGVQTFAGDKIFNGSLGIGATPTYKFQVTNSTTGMELWFNDNAPLQELTITGGLNNQASLSYRYQGTGVNAGAAIRFAKAGDAVKNWSMGIADTDNIFRIKQGYAGDGTLLDYTNTFLAIGPSGSITLNGGVTQDDTKTQMLVKDATTHQLYWRAASSLGSGDMILAAAQTSTGKKTFQADATNAGLNLSEVTSDPSTLVDGDMWYNDFQGSPKIRVANTSRHLAYTTSNTANTVPYFATSNNAQIQGDAQFMYTSAPTKILQVGTSGTSQLKVGNILFNAQTANPGSPVNGQIWYNSTDGKLRGYQGGAVVDLGGSTYTAAQGLTLSGSEFRLGGTLTGGTLTQITSTAGNGIYFSMGSGVGTNTGSLQISPGFNILKHEDPIDGIVQYNLQDGIGVLTAKEHRVEITSTSTTNTVHMPLTVHSENSTFANGFGTGIKFQLSPLDKHSASITSQFESTSLGSEDADLRFQTMRDGAAPVDRVVITSDGRLYGTALHNNTGDITGTTNQYVASGTYTPTLTGTTNVDAVVVQGADWVYMRVGNVVTVSGQINIDATAASTTTSVRGTLPIASAFANSNSHCAGTMVHTNSGVSGAIRPEPTNDEFQINFSPAVTSAQPYSLTFTYVIL